MGGRPAGDEQPPPPRVALERRVEGVDQLIDALVRHDRPEERVHGIVGRDAQLPARGLRRDDVDVCADVVRVGHVEDPIRRDREPVRHGLWRVGRKNVDDRRPIDDGLLEGRLQLRQPGVVGKRVVNGPGQCSARRDEPIQPGDELRQRGPRRRLVVDSVQDPVRPVEMEDDPRTGRARDGDDVVEILEVVQRHRRDPVPPGLRVEQRLVRVHPGDGMVGKENRFLDAEAVQLTECGGRILGGRPWFLAPTAQVSVHPAATGPMRLNDGSLPDRASVARQRSRRST
jgi:hypothetical protein